MLKVRGNPHLIQCVVKGILCENYSKSYHITIAVILDNKLCAFKLISNNASTIVNN